MQDNWSRESSGSNARALVGPASTTEGCSSLSTVSRWRASFPFETQRRRADSAACATKSRSRAICLRPASGGMLEPNVKEEALRPIRVVSTKYDGETREPTAARLLSEFAGPISRIQVAGGHQSTEESTGRKRSPKTRSNCTSRIAGTTSCSFLAPSIDRYLWYANIAMPAKFDGASTWTDLDIDVCCRLDGSIQTLDYDEFQENRLKMDYPEHVVERALDAHDEVIRLGETDAFPFDREAQLRDWTNLP